MHRLVIAAALACLSGAAAAQETVYVSPTGSDPANCSDSSICRSPSSACKTIQCAVDSTLGGETVRVAPGTYAECVSAYFCVVDPGTGDCIYVPSDITIVADDYDQNRRSDTTVIDATGLDCTGSPVVELGDLSTFRGFTVKGNSAGSGIAGYGAVQITNNIIEGNSALRGGGVYVYTGYYALTPGEQTVVRSNIVRGNSANAGGGIFVFGVSWYGATTDVQVESNTIQNNQVETSGLCPTTYHPNLFCAGGAGLFVLTDSWIDTDVSEVTITKNVVEGNSANRGTSGYTAYGGGIYASTYGYPAPGSEVIEIFDNVVRQNRVEGFGGGITAQILGTFGPSLPENPGYDVSVKENSITANTAASGGGGLHFFVQHADLDSTTKSNLLAEGNSIVGNTHDGTLPPQFAVPGGGGGVYGEVVHARNTTPNVSVRVRENTIQGNSTPAVGGGASLYVAADSEPDNKAASAQVWFENNLVTGNTASAPGLTGEGGGVYALAESRGLSNASARLRFNTVADNSVDPGGAAVFVDASTLLDSLFNEGATSIEVSNSILLRNVELELESGFTAGTNSRLLSIRYNDLYDPAGSLYGPTIGDREGQDGNSSFDPELSALYVPLLCSPVTTAGDPADGTFENGVLVSEGQPNGGIVSIGHLGNTDGAVRVFPDINGDDIVDGVDLLRVASSFASTSSQVDRYNPDADRDKDGKVDGNEISYIGAFYGQACP